MTVRDAIERRGHFAHGGDPDGPAETWIEAGFRPTKSRSGGRGDYTDMVGFRVSTWDLEVEEARDLLGVA